MKQQSQWMCLVNYKIIKILACYIMFIVKAALYNNTGGSVTKEKGQSVIFNCTADGVPQPDIIWRKNGQLLLKTSRVKLNSSEQSNGFRSHFILGVLQRTSVLTITDLNGKDNGSYSCRASTDKEGDNGVILMTPFTLQVIERKPFSVVRCLTKYIVLGPPINYCLSFPCGGRGMCRSLSSGYICDCFNGYSGINCEQGL